MDPFALVLVGGLVAFFLVIWLLGRFYPGSGLEQVGMRTAREITETREALEADDLEQMVAARNARRRARGEAEESTGDLELQVSREAAEQARRRERHVAERRAASVGGEPQADADRELDELLALTNARRRARGLPERTREQARDELGSDASARRES